MIALVIALLVVAAAAAVFALACNAVLPRLGVAIRTMIAAVAAGFVPVLVGLFLVPSFGAGIVPLLIGGAILSAVAGFPVAYLVARRKQPPVDMSVFD